MIFLGFMRFLSEKWGFRNFRGGSLSGAAARTGDLKKIRKLNVNSKKWGVIVKKNYNTDNKVVNRIIL